jgi:hypothetical protein
MPFNGNTSTYLRTWQYKWLTLENVIQDTVTIVRAVRSARRVPVSVPTVVVGGSYGAQAVLCSWCKDTLHFTRRALPSNISALLPLLNRWSAVGIPSFNGTRGV